MQAPKTPGTPQVQVTDGRHCLPAVFSKVAGEGLECSGVKLAHLNFSTVKLQVAEPIISIDCNYNTPEMCLAIPRCEVLNNDSAKAVHQFESLPLGTLPSVQQKMLEITHWSARNSNSSTSKGSPSGSIRSQAPFSPGNASDADDDISQLPFQTQVNDVTIDQKSTRSSPIVSFTERLPTGLMHNGDTNAIAQNNNKYTRLHPIHHLGAATAQGEGEFTTDSLTRPVLHALNADAQLTEFHTTPADSSPMAKVLESGQGVHGRQSVQDELGLSHLATAKRSDQINGGAQQPDCILWPGSKQEVTELPTSLVRHFRRWRDEARSGRYVPRYLQKIPKDQEALLESEDSWQPPLVGRAVIQGQIPVTLNEQFMTLTDQKDSQVEKQSPIREPVTEFQKPITPPEHKKTLPERKLESIATDVEDSDVSVASWSPSPPTQDRRRQALPADSPLPSVRQRRNSTMKFEDAKVEAPPPTRSVALSCGGDDKPLVSKSSSQVTQCTVIPLSDLIANRDLSGEEQVGEQVAGRVPDPSINELTACQNIAAETLESTIQRIVGKSITGPNKATTPQEKVVQVERTPYLLKRPLPRVVKTALGGTDITDDSGLASSGCVPCSYDERNCALLPPVQAISAVPSLEISTIPQTEALQSKHASSGGPAHGYRHSNPTEDIQQLRNLTPTCENNYGKGPSVNAEEAAGASFQTVDSVQLASTSDPSRRLDSTPSQNDHMMEAGRQTATPHSENAQIDPAPQMVLDVLTSQGHSAEVNDDAANSRTAPTKNNTNVVANLPNPAYVAELRDYRRTALTLINKQPSLSRKSSSSARDATSSVEKPRDAVAGDWSPILRTSALSPRQLSTPISHSSTYGHVEDYFKSQPSDSISQAATPMVVDLHLAFRRYQNAYPDYRGDFAAFENACRLLRKFWGLGKGFHSYLYDDAIYHHYHGFRRYLLDEAVDEETRIMTFDEYYLQRVDEPSHTKRVVGKTMIENLIRSRRLIASGQGSRRTSDAATSPFPNRNETMPVLPDCMIRLPSPELGTPDVNRNQMDTSSPESADSEKMRRPPMIPESDRSEHRVDPVTPLQRPDEIKVLKKRKRSPTFRTFIPNPLETQASTAPKPIKRPKPSASPFVKPSQPASATASAVKMTPTQKAQRWWVDSNTPFKQFERHHSSLPQETLTNEKGKNTTTSPSGNVKKIDIFSWRA